MPNTLPQDLHALLNWKWPEIEPHYDDLAARSLTASNIAEWLTDWTRLDDRVSEMYSRLHVATSANTEDKEADTRYKAFLDEIYPAAEAAEQKLREKLLASGLEPKGFELPLKKMRTEVALFRQANLALMTEERKLAIEYDKVVGAQTVTWEGEEVTLSRLRPVYLNDDRAKREQAWRAATQRQLADRPAINALWQKFMPLRQKLADNAGKRSYRDFRWQQMLRLDYTPANCISFHDAIEEAVVPAAKRLYEKRRKKLGVQTLRPWDLDVDPLGRAPLKPFTNMEDLKKTSASIFHRVDSRLGGYYDTMVRESLLDLDNRKNKAPGGFCTSFPMSKRPFIFMNAVGLHDDLQTMLHESGHAFHNFERDALPYSQQRQVGLEFAEVASMSMELLAAPYLAAKEGGVYSEADAARARVEHLEKNILFWPYMAVVDAFQHWAYENAADASDPSKCDARWKVEWDRFMGGVDWSGLEEELVTGWHRKLHIFEVPFYYVEYGLAQLGAVQVWANALRDQAGAVARYRQALGLGGTASLPQLFAAAGAKFAFDAATLRQAVDLMEQTIEKLERNV